MPAENGSQSHVPTVLWAQRDDKVFLTISVEDIEKPEIRIEENSLYFSGSANKTNYLLNIDFYKPVNKAESKYGIYGQKHWMFILKKLDKGPYWPRLLKDAKKVHWLKADWNKWKDEDDEEEEEGGMGGMGGMPNQDFGSMFEQMGGLGGGLGGENDLPNLDDIEDKNETDSDDEKLPDLEENKSDESKPQESSSAEQAAPTTA